MIIGLRISSFKSIGIVGALFFASSALADVDGVWRGTLSIAPGNELVVEFTIEVTGDDNYSAVLNTPESAAIENVAANAVSYSDDVLSIEVTDLSGGFVGRLEGDSLVGQWSQLDQSFPLELSLYAAPTFSEAQIASIEGRWEGTITRDGTALQAVIWRFEVDDSGDLIGFMGPAARDVAFIPMQNITITDAAITFTVNDAQGNYFGEISAAGVAGNWSQQGTEATLNMTSRADAEPVIFSDELIASVVGDWSGTIVINASTSQDVLWRFESTEPGKVVGFMGPAAQGVATIPMQNIMITETDFSFNVYDAGGEFTGKFSDNGLEGTWSQGEDMSITMSRN